MQARRFFEEGVDSDWALGAHGSEADAVVGSFDLVAPRVSDVVSTVAGEDVEEVLAYVVEAVVEVGVLAEPLAAMLFAEVELGDGAVRVS